jgi:dihydrofolate synthase/folylpolyglutamate synthase
LLLIMMGYREAIDWLFSTQMFGIKLGLDGPRRLLKQALAHPEHGTRVIHVAGTNGKGSTCAMIDAVARAAGIRTGLFTSPHLVDYRERIRVSGVEIPEDECAARLTALRELCATLDPHPTFFEITLALAMQWFRARGCELIILETGRGGRLDATTAVDADVCVITPIGMDHMQWLGDTLGQIAWEKAGILVPGKPCVSAPQKPEAAIVIEREANERRSPLEFVDEPLRGYHIALAGEHQQWNAALALRALHRAGVALNPDIVRHGLGSVQWPARFERMENGRIVIDGAHNPHAAEVLAATWQTQYPGEKAALVFSAVAAKDVAGILAWIAPLADRIFICPVDSPRAMTTTELATALPEGSPPHEEFASFDAAFAAARASGQRILVAGSLFLAGEARAMLAGGDYQSSTQ